jgi:uracil-DNA glycosylase
VNNTILKLDESWKKYLDNDLNSEYFKNILNFLKEENKKFNVYPKQEQMFSAFCLTPFNKVKVVIIGQDPYHGKGQANGLCFSVNDGIKKPPSLVNIFKEIKNDIGGEIPESGNLEHWAKQGVLLLNSSLSVRAEKASSHQNIGWHLFTDSAIKSLSDHRTGIVFILWGKFAQLKEKLINTEKHHLLKSVHPSPLSAYKGFFGCNHFSKTNKILMNSNLKKIEWVK